MKKSLLLSLLAMVCAGGLLADTIINLHDLTNDCKITSGGTYVLTGGSVEYKIIFDGAKNVLLRYSGEVYIDLDKGKTSGCCMSLVNNSEVTLQAGSSDDDELNIWCYDSSCIEIENGSKLTIDASDAYQMPVFSTESGSSVIGSPKTGTGGELVINGPAFDVLQTAFGSIGDSKFSKITINGGDIIQMTPASGYCYEADDIVINGGNLLAYLVKSETDINLVAPTFSVDPVNNAGKDVYPILLPDAFDASAEEPVYKQYEVRTDTGTYMTYSGYGAFNYFEFAPNANSIIFYLPNGTYSLTKDSKTYSCTVNDGPGTFTETPEPAILSLLLLGLGLVIRRK